MSTVTETLHHDDDHHEHHAPPAGIKRWLYTTNHKDIGTFINAFSSLRPSASECVVSLSEPERQER